MRELVGFAMILGFYSQNAAASYCYPDYCANVTLPALSPGFQCLLTRVQKDGDCMKLVFDGYNEPKWGEGDTDKFTLRAYVYEDFGTKATAFNLSVTNITFSSLVTRYQNLLDRNESACRHIELYGNETHPAPKELYVSCPFADESYESIPYQLDYFVTGKGFKYSRRYIFHVPVHRYIYLGTNVKEYKPFVYIDASHAPLLSLHVQPLPEFYNVTKYRVWLMNNDTDSVVFTEDMFSTASKQDIRYNFTAHTGVFYFQVSPLHFDCGRYGCANSTTPFIIIQETSHRLLIMIISTVWIPPVILYVLYHLYKLYRKEPSKTKGTANCLLVYAPTRLSHINVMIELAKYFRTSKINATIDMLDVADITDQEATQNWCNVAFHTADVILVATSPSGKKTEGTVSSPIHRNDNYLLKLIKEQDCSLREKRYYVVQLPYCKEDDVPAETKHFKRFCLPNELSKLVKTIRQADIGRPCVSEKAFLDSVKIAKIEILGEEDTSTKKCKETENLLSLECPTMTQNDNSTSKSYTTNIDELNLLGKEEEEERDDVTRSVETSVPISEEIPSSNVSVLRIDQLNL